MVICTSFAFASLLSRVTLPRSQCSCRYFPCKMFFRSHHPTRIGHHSSALVEITPPSDDLSQIVWVVLARRALFRRKTCPFEFTQIYLDFETSAVSTEQSVVRTPITINPQLTSHRNWRIYDFPSGG